MKTAKEQSDENVKKLLAESENMSTAELYQIVTETGVRGAIARDTLNKRSGKSSRVWGIVSSLSAVISAAGAIVSIWASK